MEVTIVAVRPFQGGVVVRVIPKEPDAQEDELTLTGNMLANVQGRGLLDGVEVGERFNATAMFGAAGYQVISINSQQRSV